MKSAQEWGGMYQRYKKINLNKIQRSNELVSQDKECLERRNDSVQNFFEHSLFVLLLNVAYFVDQTQTISVGFLRPCDPMPLEFLPCLALRPFCLATS